MPLPSKLPFLALVTLICFLTGSCKIISFNELSITTFPGEYGEIIEEGEIPWVRFSMPPNKKAVEDMVIISSGDGTIDLSTRWEDDTLYLSPVSAFVPGVRYFLSCKGPFLTADGRTYTVSKELPFFYHSSQTPPRMTSCFPENGADWDTTTPLVFEFDRSMENVDFTTSFSITPAVQCHYEFSDSNARVTVRPVSNWQQRTLYTWEISERLSDTSGVPLQKRYTGCFRVQSDQAAPVLVDWGPVQLIGPLYLPQTGFGGEDELMLQFSEEIDLPSLEEALSVEPGSGGNLEKIGPATYVYTPFSPFSMNETYRLHIRSGLCDLSGNYLQEEINHFFTTEIPVQTVTSIRCIGNTTITVPSERFNAPDATEITFTGPGPDYTQIVEIDFAEPYEENCFGRMADAVSLIGYFPESVSHPVLEQVVWLPDGKTLRLLYGGLQKSPPAGNPEIFLYKLTVPGGKEIAETASGSYVFEDLSVYLQAEREPS